MTDHTPTPTLPTRDEYETAYRSLSAAYDELEDIVHRLSKWAKAREESIDGNGTQRDAYPITNQDLALFASFLDSMDSQGLCVRRMLAALHEQLEWLNIAYLDTDEPVRP